MGEHRGEGKRRERKGVGDGKGKGGSGRKGAYQHFFSPLRTLPKLVYSQYTAGLNLAGWNDKTEPEAAVYISSLTISSEV